MDQYYVIIAFLGFVCLVLVALLLILLVSFRRLRKNQDQKISGQEAEIELLKGVVNELLSRNSLDELVKISSFCEQQMGEMKRKKISLQDDRYKIFLRLGELSYSARLKHFQKK